MSLKQIKIIECITSPFINSAKIKLRVWSTLKEQLFHLAGKAGQQEELTCYPVLVVLK